MGLVTCITAAALTLVAASDAFSCEATDKAFGGEKAGPSCAGRWTDEDEKEHDLINVCYRDATDAGCVPAMYESYIDTSEPGCNEHGCWCLTDKCNTAEWFNSFKASYVPPPQCFTGIAGANVGATCSTSEIYDENKFESPNCYSRGMSNRCVENNKHVGMGDGCSDYPDQSSCEAYRPEGRDPRSADDSFDGSDSHCRWIPPKTKAARENECEADDSCTFYANRGHCSGDTCEGNCEDSDLTKQRDKSWKDQLGTDCEKRLETGCFENNEWMGENERCTQHKDGVTCLAVTDGCSEGVCSGIPNEAQPCDSIYDRGSCEREVAGEPSGCSWTQQCCRWMPAITNLTDACMNNGKGTLDGVCAYNAKMGSCEETQLMQDSRYDPPDCMSRDPGSGDFGCFENNDWLGRGDGCNEHPHSQDQASCEAYTPVGREPRSATEGDGSGRHCRWVTEKNKTTRKVSCENDDKCTFYEDRGHCEGDTCKGECAASKSEMAKNDEWERKKGKDCSQRIWQEACFENNQWLGQSEQCTQHKEENACNSHSSSDCHNGQCSGTANPAPACEKRRYEHDCSNDGSGCTFVKQCCQWLPHIVDNETACLTGGAGTLAGACNFNDGEGPPAKSFIEAGFENKLFSLRDRFDNKCGMIASFRDGKGSATALGGDFPDLIGLRCSQLSSWEGVAEHTGHTKTTIAEYCKNFIPDASAMAAVKAHSPSELIQKAEQGQFATIFPDLKDLMFIITARPQFGKCLFFAKQGIFGAGVCTCGGPECNNKAALDYVVDRDVGPMRLLQFIDGSLSGDRDAVNSVVPNLLDDNGIINRAEVGKVTEANVIAIMKVPGMASKTNKDELWSIVQDYQKLAQTEADYKAVGDAMCDAADDCSGYGILTAGSGKRADGCTCQCFNNYEGLKCELKVKKTTGSQIKSNMQLSFEKEMTYEDLRSAAVQNLVKDTILDTIGNAVLTRDHIETTIIKATAGRRLAMGVIVDYTINIPADLSGVSATVIQTSMNNTSAAAITQIMAARIAADPQLEVKTGAVEVKQVALPTKLDNVEVKVVSSVPLALPATTTLVTTLGTPAPPATTTLMSTLGRNATPLGKSPVLSSDAATHASFVASLVVAFAATP